MKYKMNLMYDGSKFRGFSRQKHKNTVQDELELHLSDLFKEQIKVIGASRTDSKVHALDQWVIFEGKNNIDPKRLVNALNVLVDDAILIKDCDYNDDDFQPRYMSTSKTYEYIITSVKDPFTCNYKTYFKEELDLYLMQEACQYFIGTHDFSSCCASNTYVTDKVRTINSLTVTKEGEDIKIVVNGDGFLYNMVRIIAGNLIYVGLGKIKPSEIETIINKRDRRASAITAPPNGLYLKQIFYDII